MTLSIPWERVGLMAGLGLTTVAGLTAVSSRLLAGQWVDASLGAGITLAVVGLATRMARYFDALPDPEHVCPAGMPPLPITHCALEVVEDEGRLRWVLRPLHSHRCYAVEEGDILSLVRAPHLDDLDEAKEEAQ